DEGYEILEVQRDPDFVPKAVELSLVGCFLTASLIHYSTMRSTMRELRSSPWTFNNHLLMLHHLGKGKDPLKVPLIFINFWVQIHSVPPSFFTESLARQIGSFLGNFLEFNGANLGHNDSFCQAKMALRYEVAKIGWDLSLRANSGRASAMRVNLEGDLNLVSLWNGGSSKEKGQLEMDHDLEDSVMRKRDLEGRKTDPKQWMS
ncbi:hypothetical protein Golax_021821, partial [Gossypium laxum]|nr:hypothetical protein [Gossypium laxum]